MMIIGAKGSAKDVLVVFEEQSRGPLAFFDDTGNSEKHLFGKYPILKSENEAREWMKTNGPEFAVAIGHTRSREKLVDKFLQMRGKWSSLVSEDATIGKHSKIGSGSIILPGARISNGIEIGDGAFFGVNAIVGHDCSIGRFVTLSPGSTVLGYVSIGDFSYIGADCTLLPKVNVGKHVLLGAATVLDRDAKDYESIVSQRRYEE